MIVYPLYKTTSSHPQTQGGLVSVGASRVELEILSFICCFKNLDRYSMPMTKSRGDMRSPCLTQRLPLKGCKGFPFMIREYWEEDTQVITLFTNRVGKLRAIIISFRKSQFRVS